MTTILVLDPNGVKRKIPYDDLYQAMEAGGKFASKDEQAKAISLGQINKQYPDMPNWLKSSILFATNKPKAGFAKKVAPVSDVINDVGAMAKNAPGEAAGALGAIPDQALDSAMQIWNDPFPHPQEMLQDPRHFYKHGGAFPRIAGNVLSGLLGTAKNIQNQPAKTAEYLADKGLIPKGISDYYQKTRIPEDTGLERAVMGEEQPGDVLWKQLGPAAFGGKLLAANPIAGGAAYAGLQGENPFAGALVGKVFEGAGKAGANVVKNIREGGAQKAAAVEEATNQHEAADRELKQAQVEAGVDTPHALQKRIHATKESLAESTKSSPRTS